MHVTIIQLKTEPTSECGHHSEDSIFGDNQDKFPDGVEEHFGKDREEDVDTLVEWLGDAARTGTETSDAGEVRWIELDREKAIGLFAPHFKAFTDALLRLTSYAVRDFATGGHGMEAAVQRLHDSYLFDGIYVVGDTTYAQPVSDWLRCVIGTPDLPVRYYVGATYDGDQ